MPQLPSTAPIPPEAPMPPFLRVGAVPWAGAAVVVVVGIVEFVLDARGPGPLGTAAVLGAVALAGALAPWAPVGAAVVVGATFPLGSALGLDGPNGAQLFALLLSTGWAGSQSPPRRSWMAPAADQVLATVGILLWGAAPSQAWENLFFSLLLWGSWGVGLLTRRSRERAEQLGRLAVRLDAEREIAEAAAVATERARIARDVHDSVAHSVSVMVLQLGALRTTLEPEDRVAGVLEGVERLGRQSVDELRGLVGLLRRTTADPVAPPSLARVPELIEEIRAAGLPVQWEVAGRPRPLPQALDVSAYRVLQEGLSNVLRHAGPVPTSVVLRHDPAAFVVEVRDDGPAGPSAPAPTGPDGVGGHGLLGVRERVAVFGGAVEAGPLPGGGFRLRARFPLQDPR